MPLHSLGRSCRLAIVVDIGCKCGKFYPKRSRIQQKNASASLLKVYTLVHSCAFLGKYEHFGDSLKKSSQHPSYLCKRIQRLEVCQYAKWYETIAR